MSDRPYIRLERGNTPWARLFYDGPPALGTTVNYTLTPPGILHITRRGRIQLDPAGPVCGASVAVELTGAPQLLSATSGQGGPLYAGSEAPLRIPADTPVGSVMLLGLAAIDLGRGLRQYLTYDGTFHETMTRTVDVERPWVPPGWSLVRFDVTDGGWADQGLVMGVYSRVCQSGDPGTLVNPYGYRMDLPVLYTDPEPPVLAPPDPTNPPHEGNWVGQLRIYAGAAVGRSRMAVSHSAQDNPAIASSELPNHNPQGAAGEVIPVPGIWTPLAISGAAHRAQFFALQGSQFDLILPGGVVADPDFTGVAEATDAAGHVQRSSPPLLCLASEELTGAETTAATTDPPAGLLVSGVGRTLVHVEVTGGPRTLTADVTIDTFRLPSKLATDGSGTVLAARAVKAASLVPVSFANEDAHQTVPTVITSRGLQPGARYGARGEIDQSGRDDGTLAAGQLAVWKWGPPGPLGPGVSWTTVAHWAGGASSDFSIPDQVDHGATVAGPSLTVVSGSLTTSDKHQVEVVAGVTPDYHGDKYQAIWTAAGASGDGSKLRAKLSTLVPGGPAGTFAVTLNTADRQHGLGFYGGLRYGWTRDLRLLGTVQSLVSASPTDQSFARLTQFPTVVSGAGNTPVLDPNDGHPIAYGSNLQNSFPFLTPALVWIEVWRDGNTIHAGVWMNDPASGAPPVWVEDYLLDSAYALAQWGPSAPGEWGVTFDYLDPAGVSALSNPMGIVELTLFQS